MIVIYRVTERKLPKVTKAAKVEMERKLATSRVNRPAIVDLFTSGAFDTLPTLPTEYRNAPRLRVVDGTAASHGWIVPSDDLGRTGRADQSVANSIRLWITKNLSVDPAAFAIVCE